MLSGTRLNGRIEVSALVIGFYARFSLNVTHLNEIGPCRSPYKVLN